MLLDASLTLSSAQNLAAQASQPSQGVIDIAGVGVGQASPNIIGTATVFGEDIGIGDGPSPPGLICIVGTAFATATGATLQVQLQAAIDAGAGVPGAYQNIAQTDAIPVAQLLAGRKIAEFTIPPRYPGQAMPRFYRLNYVIPAGTNFTAGSIAYAGVSIGRDDAPMYPANF